MFGNTGASQSYNSKAFLDKKIVSADGPKPAEVAHEPSLLEWCTTCIEPEEESNRRRVVLERINYIVRLWIRHTMITEFHMPENAAAQVEGRIFATGSYRYNVHTSGSDIDMVLIAPSRITREHFFNTLAPRLRNESWVTELHCIRESRVPIIAMVCDGIDIDLSFGSIRQDRVPEVITDDLLQGLDEQSVLGCNAVRVAHNIMDLVPNKATFRQTLRFVKAWGKARAIYSNTFGFPSGIGWAILCAFVCQCYPHQNAAGMVSRFFRTYHAWFMPNPHESGVDNRAIYITETMRAKTNLGRCWDPRESRSDAMALFPVLTPALPYGNACYNVTLTNLRQLCEEFRRGHEIVGAHLHKSPAEVKAEFGSYGLWSALLQPATFFGVFRHYLHIQVSCSEGSQYQAYVDAVESRIRILWAGNASSRGCTLEDYRQLRLQLNPRRYEDPAEVERRTGEVRRGHASAAATNANSAYNNNSSNNNAFATSNASGRAANTKLHAAIGGKSAPGYINPASVNSHNSCSNVGAAHAPNMANAFSGLYTAHYFIGMTVDTKVSSAPIDLTPAIRVFHTVVRQLRQYQEGVTRLPAVSVCTIAKVPQFVKDCVGYVDVDPSTVTPAQPAAGAAAAADSSSSSVQQTTTTSASVITSTALTPAMNADAKVVVDESAKCSECRGSDSVSNGTRAQSLSANAMIHAMDRSLDGEPSSSSSALQAVSQHNQMDGAQHKRTREEVSVNSMSEATCAKMNSIIDRASTNIRTTNKGSNNYRKKSWRDASDEVDLEQALGLDF